MPPVTTSPSPVPSLANEPTNDVEVNQHPNTSPNVSAADGDTTTSQATPPSDTTSSYGSPPPLELITPIDSVRLIVRKRNGMPNALCSAKMENTLRRLSYGLHIEMTIVQDIVHRTVRGLKNDTPTTAVQDALAITTNNFSFVHPDYGILAGRLFVDRVHKSTMKAFSNWVTAYSVGDRAILRPDFVAAVMEHASELDEAILHSRDTQYYFYSLQILYKFYLLRYDGHVVERPQFLYMRIAVSLHGTDLERVLQTYELLSTCAYSPATPVLYNAGTLRQNLASCFLYQPPATSTVASMAVVVRDLADMWNADGGVGISLGTISCVRSSSLVHSSGTGPVLDVLNAYAGLISANRWRRSSSITTYLPVWHADVVSFVYSSTHRTTIPSGLKHVFPALWVPDEFMRRLEAGGTWSLFDPDDIPSLSELAGAEFAEAYETYERSGLAVREVDISVLWAAIVDSARETGTPFILFQDNINARNNEAHLGIIRSSNLCTEIIQFSSPTYPAVCTLASISLPHFINHDGVFNFDELHRVTKLVVYNTDKTIDILDYPTNALRESATRTRALGVGVQGFADALMMLHIPFALSNARSFNISVFETIYHASLEASSDLAEVSGPYPAWDGSPASEGVLQMDMWEHVPSARYDFDLLRSKIKRVGLRNSVITSLMPTATTSKILGNFEAFEPYSSPHIVLRTDSGDFPLICPHLVRDLESRGLWTEPIRQDVLRSHNSISGCNGIPDDIKAIYQTVWDIDPLNIIQMAADRAPFIDQSQSLTLCVRNPTPEYMKTLLLNAWANGLKTGMYYLRTLHPIFDDVDADGPFGARGQRSPNCCA